MPSLRRTLLAPGPVTASLVALLVIGATLTYLVFYSLTQTRDRLLISAARQSATAMVNFASTATPNLDLALTEGVVTVSQQMTLNAGLSMKSAFQISLYQTDGTHLETFDASGRGIRPDAYTPLIQQAVADRRTIVELITDPGAGSSDAVAFVPVWDSSYSVVGVMLIAIDQSALFAAFDRGFSRLVIAIPLLCGLAFLIPGIGVLITYLQKRDHLRRLELTRFDELTGLLNRRAFEESATASVARAIHTGSNATAAIFFIDLDKFKPINDTHGHACGDAFLRFAADAIRDVIGPDDIAARLGGDEFVIILPDTSELAARRVGQRLLKRLGQAFRFEGHEVYGGASIGIALVPATNPVMSGLCAADSALYAAKNAGGHRVHLTHGPESVDQALELPRRHRPRAASGKQG